MNEEEEISFYVGPKSINRCLESKKISQKIFDFMIHVPKVQEESITDYLLWQWSVIDKKMKYNLYNKTEESKNGADFSLELWIIKSSYAIPLLIQAKKMKSDEKKLCAESINYNVYKPGDRQYDKLITTARKEKKIPLYLFYALPDNKTMSNCKICGVESYKDNSVLYFLSAFSIKSLGKCYKKTSSTKRATIDHLTKNDILDNAINMCCLYCCKLKCKKDKKLTENIDYEYKINGLNNLPKHVTMLLENKKGSSINRNIAIIDLRK